MRKEYLGWALFAFAGVAMAFSPAVSFACVLAICLLAYIDADAETARAELESRSAIEEERVVALEDSLEKLKGTAAALLKVEARTSAVERSLAHQMREDI